MSLVLSKSAASKAMLMNRAIVMRLPRNYKGGNSLLLHHRILVQELRQQQQQQHQQQQYRCYTLDNHFGGDSSQLWPIRKMNTILNIVPQGKCFVVERFGRLHHIYQSGFFFAIPLVDQIAYVIDVRERAMDILPQAAITRDNVSVQVSGNLFVRVENPELAAYGATNPLYSVTQHAQSAMRSAIGEMELDEILHGRAKLNSIIKGTLQEAAVAWGLEVRRYELTEISPDEQIRIAMDKQAAAERDRREHVLRAEGAKRKAELESEGVKIALKNESEGNLIRVTNESEANKLEILREAEGLAESIRIKADAQAEGIRVVAAAMQQEGGIEAARLALAKDYVAMYGEMGQQSNTMIFNDRPADVSALMTQVVTALNAANKLDQPPQQQLQQHNLLEAEPATTTTTSTMEASPSETKQNE